MGAFVLLRRTVIATLGVGAAALACGLPRLARADAIGAESWLGYDARLRGLLETPPGDGFQPAVEAALLTETNRYRAAQGAPHLSSHAGLDRVARAAAADMASRNFFDHHSPEGHAPSVRVGLLARELCGASGENIAYQQGGDAPPTAHSFFEQWRDSPGHRENMVRPAYSHVGHGVVRVDDRTYAVATFAEEQVRLGGEPPLVVRDNGQFGQAVAMAAPRFERFQISAPDGDAMSSIMELGEMAQLPAGAWRLRPHLAESANRFRVLWGPIFVA